MSGSFWKFGQDYATESSLARLLNTAFIKIKPEQEEQEEKHDNEESNTETKEHEKEQEEEELPDTEAGFKEYEPNLDVLCNLLDEEELYTELMCSNFKLLVYLKYPTVLSKLMDYVMVDNIIAKDNLKQQAELVKSQEEVESDDMKEDTDNSEDENDEDEEDNMDIIPDDGEDIESQRAHMAAEILSADVWPISAAIIEHPDLLHKLWSITNLTGELPIEASTYFMKINERLLDMNMSSMIDFILDQNDIVDRFLQHIDDPPLIDFFLKVISTDKPDINNGVISTLKHQGLIPKLVELLTPEYDANTQSAASDFLKALLAISGNCVDEIASSIGPNELTRQLTSPKVMERLIQIMLNGGTSLSNGVGIIIELIRKNNSDYDYVQIMFTTLETHPPNDRDAIYLGHMLKLFHQYMPKFNDILVNTSKPILNTSFGRIEPLGFERFKICELVAELLHCSNMGLVNEKKGEEIVLERDRVRSKILNGEDPNDDDDLLKKKPQEYGGEEVTDRLNSLTIESEHPILNDATTSPNGELEEHDEGFAENIPDDDTVVQQLREKAVVGDLLKISLLDTQIVTTIIEMFFHFSWNNFLHNVVFDIIQQIFNGPLKSGFNRFLLKDLLVNAEITNLIMEGDKECIKQEEDNKPRTGYMGHLTLIAEEIVKFSAYIDEMNISFTTDSIHDYLNNNDWKEYVETTLAERREKYDLVLGDVPPNEEEEEEDDDTNGGYHHDEEDEPLDDNYDSHVSGTEHIIFTNELDDDEEEEEDNDGGDGSDGLYEDAENYIPGEGEEQDRDSNDDGEDQNISSSPLSGNFHEGFNHDEESDGEFNLPVRNDDEEEEEYAEYSERENKNYYEYIDHNGTKTVLYTATIEPEAKDKANSNSDSDSDDERQQQPYSPSQFNKINTKNIIPKSPAGLFDYDLTSSDEEDHLDQGQDYIEENDKRRKLSRRSSYSDDDDDNEDSLDDAAAGATMIWDSNATSPSFALQSPKESAKGPALNGLDDEDIFQNEFEIGSAVNSNGMGPGLTRVGSGLHNLDEEADRMIDDGHNSDEDEDNYLDPNDDGQSYAKTNNPLYADVMSKGGVPAYYSANGYYSSNLNGNTAVRNDSEEELSENSDEEENAKTLDEDENPSMEESFILYRSTSKGKENWN